jgi:hypothetical protein
MPSAPSALATRLSPVEIRSPGPIAPEPEEIAPYFPQLEILDLIGRGGMGVVYKARQKGLDRFIALKVLFPEINGDPTFGERFHREARALARLSHPNIVAVHDIGRSAGLCYLLLEYVDGPNLRQLIQAEEIDVAQGLAIVIQLCDALQYAHDEHVVHRDVKPDNILLKMSSERATGMAEFDESARLRFPAPRQPLTVKIADFGIAKLAGRTPVEVALTASRQVMGTLFYMAPEQFERPRAVDHRADLYSVGVVLYEVLTGELPMGNFAAPSQRVAIDPRLDRVVMQALEKQPERRYQRAVELKKDLESCLQTHTPFEVLTAPSGVGQVSGLPGIVGQAGNRSYAREPAAEVVTAERLLRGPALGMLIAGSLATLGLVIFAGIMIGLALGEAAVAERAGVVAKFWTGYWVMVVGTLAGPLLLAAGRRMERLQSFRFAQLASVLGLVNTILLPSPFNLLCLPIAVWCICTLLRREVKSAFRPQVGFDRLERGLALLTTVCVALIVCVVAVFAGRG